MKSTKITTKSTIIISLTALLFVIVLLTLHATKTTKLYLTDKLIPYTLLYDNTLSHHIPQIIQELGSTTQKTDYHIEDGEIIDPFIQNPLVIPEVLKLDEDTNS